MCRVEQHQGLQRVARVHVVGETHSGLDDAVQCRCVHIPCVHIGSVGQHLEGVHGTDEWAFEFHHSALQRHEALRARVGDAAVAVRHSDHHGLLEHAVQGEFVLRFDRHHIAWIGRGQGVVECARAPIPIPRNAFPVEGGGTRGQTDFNAVVVSVAHVRVRHVPCHLWGGHDLEAPRLFHHTFKPWGLVVRVRDVRHALGHSGLVQRLRGLHIHE